MSNYALTWQGQRASHNPMESTAHLSNGVKIDPERALEDVGTMANAQTWTKRKLEDGDIEYHDGTRVRAILQKRAGQSFKWVVHRVDSTGRIGGCDSFKTLSDAVWFITNGRIFK